MGQAQYGPLNPVGHEIRLLTLQPGLWNDDIVCNLSIVSLDDKPEYEALSYTWGDSRDLRTITLHGHRVKVTKNLYYALRRLRRYSTPRVMWVDAICINQADEVEKSAQVAMMSKVYSSCCRAVVWLGEDPELAEAINHRTQPISKTAQRAFELLSIMATDDHWSEKPCFELQGDSSIAVHEDYIQHFEDLNACASLPWWSRVWVLQESALPPSVTFTWASETYAFERFQTFLEALLSHAGSCCDGHYRTLDERSGIIIQMVWKRLENTLEARHSVKASSNTTLSELYQSSIGMQATQPKDLFYGLLGMVTEWNKAGPLTVDYTLTNVESLVRAFVYCMQQDRSLEVLTSRREKKNRYSGPTWFPDIIYDPEKDYDLIKRQNLTRMIQAHSDSSSRGCDEAQIIRDSTLALAGTRVGCVAKSSASFHWKEVENESIIRAMKESMLMAGIVAWPAQAPLENSMHDMFWKSIIHDCVRSTTWQPEMDTYRRADTSDYSDCLDFLRAVLATRNDALRVVPSQFWDSLPVTIDGSRMFVTDVGRLGIGHMDCEVGDEVWILNGSTVPHILRPSGKFITDPYANDAEALLETHEMVGEAYVHGLMYHEEHSDEIKALVPETVYLI